MFFATMDPGTLEVADPRGEVLPRLQFAQALVRERGAGERVVSLSLNTDALRSRAPFKPRPPLPVSQVAAKHGVDPRQLAAAFSRGTCEALLRFTSGLASQEDLVLLDELGLRKGKEATRLALACLELCRDSGILPQHKE